MENRINVAELLKDCPKGMELYCTMFDNVKFIRVEENDKPICIRTGDTYCYLTKFGTWTLDENAKCVIFPKGKTTWEGFVPPCKFKDGDIVTNIEGAVIIYKGITTCGYCGSFVSLDRYNQFIPHYQSYLTGTIRFATDDEKAKLFQAIKGNGYKWNAETKTLEKFISKNKFVVGATITNGKTISKIVSRDVDSYKLEDGNYVFFNEVHKWELVPNKFEINTLKPFDKVLVRGNVGQRWVIDFFGFMDNNKGFPFVCVGHYVTQCIPYEGNEHLLGTTEDCE